MRIDCRKATADQDVQAQEMEETEGTPVSDFDMQFKIRSPYGETTGRRHRRAQSKQSAVPVFNPYSQQVVTGGDRPKMRT